MDVVQVLGGDGLAIGGDPPMLSMEMAFVDVVFGGCGFGGEVLGGDVFVDFTTIDHIHKAIWRWFCECG